MFDFKRFIQSGFRKDYRNSRSHTGWVEDKEQDTEATPILRSEKNRGNY